MNSARLLVIALAHGLAIAFLAGATGAISGGHLNPAVTVAFVVAGKETLVRAGMYIGAQVDLSFQTTDSAGKEEQLTFLRLG